MVRSSLLALALMAAPCLGQVDMRAFQGFTYENPHTFSAVDKFLRLIAASGATDETMFELCLDATCTTPLFSVGADGKANFIGPLGIGTVAPDATLHIVSDAVTDPLRVDAFGLTDAFRVLNDGTLEIGDTDLFSSAPGQLKTTGLFFAAAFNSNIIKNSFGTQVFAQDVGANMAIGGNGIGATQFTDVIFDNSGNVGIGTSTPNGKLDVNLAAGEKSCTTTPSGTICDHGLQATAPVTCTVNDIYSDTSPAQCWCSSTDSWTVISPSGTCT